MKNYTENMVEKLFPDPFLKNLNWAISGSIAQSFMQFVFIVCQVERYRNILKLGCRPLARTSSKAFLKNKKKSGTSFPGSFFAWFLKENVSLAILY